MNFSNPIREAAIEAGKAGACPLGYVGQFALEHWATDEICSWFGCAECVATPRDLGYDMDEWPDPSELPKESPYTQWLNSIDVANPCVPF